MDPEMEELPTDIMRGLDFNVKKTQKGGYADYSTSTWARKESALTQAEQEAIETHGLFNLADFLPKRPGEAEMRVIKEMFEASVDGKSFDNERWGSYYRPYGLEAPSGSAPTASAPVAPVATSAAPWQGADVEEDSPVVAPTKAASGDKAQDILALIRARQNKTV
jgi:hypothetical protein